jgi:hypothetical protein
MAEKRRRWLVISVMFVAGLGVALAIARIWAPHWPGFCQEITVQKPCEVVAVQTMTGYLLIAFGFATMFLVPIIWSLVQVAKSGHRWETERGPESIVTNLPIAAGIAYIAIGALLAATA